MAKLHKLPWTQTSSMNVLEGRGENLNLGLQKLLMEDGDMMETKKDLGQFFTPKFIVEFMIGLIKKKNLKY